MDSRANLVAWKSQLGVEEVARVRALTADVADRWYPQNQTGWSAPGGDRS